MKRTSQRIIINLSAVRRALSSTTKLALATLCGLLLVSGSLAQEQRPEGRSAPEQATPEAVATPKAPDPNQSVTPSPLASQVVDGDIVFTSPGQSTYPRDIRLSDNFGGLRFYGADSLTASPAGAAIQFFGNNASPFNGQLYLDSGALNSAALIFRTAGTGGTITERMRIRADGKVAIGTDSAAAQVDIAANNTSTALRALNFTVGSIGIETQAVGSGIGVLARSGGTGVSGQSTGGDGVSGLTSISSPAGVRGTSTGSEGNGVIGEANNGSFAYGVWGRSTNGRAGNFSGNVNITGTLSKSSGSFKIDHPLDPENKYLYHSFVESPDMMNIYNGVTLLDANGEATVELPQWFDALNKDFRYQLTAIGAPAPDLHIAAKVTANRFRIAGGKPEMEVSWQVTGIRRDAYAEKHRIPVEEDKPERERGFYLHPEVFNQPEEKGVEWAVKPEAMRRMKEERLKAQQQSTTPQP